MAKKVIACYCTTFSLKLKEEAFVLHPETLKTQIILNKVWDVAAQLPLAASAEGASVAPQESGLMMKSIEKGAPRPKIKEYENEIIPATNYCQFWCGCYARNFMVHLLPCIIITAYGIYDDPWPCWTMGALWTPIICPADHWCWLGRSQ